MNLTHHFFLCTICFRLQADIFNLTFIQMSNWDFIISVVFLDPTIMNIAVWISCYHTWAKINVISYLIPVKVCNLWLSTYLYVGAFHTAVCVVVLSDPENMGLAVGILLLSCIQAKIYVMSYQYFQLMTAIFDFLSIPKSDKFSPAQACCPTPKTGILPLQYHLSKLRFVLLCCQSRHPGFLTFAYLTAPNHHQYNTSGMSVPENWEGDRCNVMPVCVELKFYSMLHGVRRSFKINSGL